MRPYIILKLLAFLLVLAISACQSSVNYAPVIDRKGQVSAIPNSHTVILGETLYSIAWRYNMDFKGLANTNEIEAPFTIFPGQKLLLKPLDSTAKRTAKSQADKTAKVSTEKNNSKNKTSPIKKKTNTNLIKISSIEKDLADKKRYPSRWQWPVKGKLIRRFNQASATHKGIDIKGKLGEPVHAANSGKVVYAGSGLVGYGKLLIIKHDERYLSAYGHNRKLLVKEGELVKVGQPIAEVGNTGTEKVKLHFEIRRDGKPINPLGLLPKG